MYLSTLTILIFVVLHYNAADGLALSAKFPVLVAAQDRCSPLEVLSRRRIFGTIVAGVVGTTILVPPSPSVAVDEKSNVYADEMIMPTENNTSQSVSILTKQPMSSFFCFFFSTPKTRKIRDLQNEIVSVAL